MVKKRERSKSRKVTTPEQVKVVASPRRQVVSSSELVETKPEAEFILESSTDGIMTIDSERCIVTFNATMERLTGWKKEEAIGAHYSYDEAHQMVEDFIAGQDE